MCFSDVEDIHNLQTSRAPVWQFQIRQNLLEYDFVATTST